MISRSRKKHRITARRSTRATRISLALLLGLGGSFGTGGWFGPARAADPVLRPVPKFSGTPVRDPQRVAATASSVPSPTRTTGQLRWRTSGEVAPTRPEPATATSRSAATRSPSPAAIPATPSNESASLRFAAAGSAVVQADSGPADPVPANPFRTAPGDEGRVSRVQFELPPPTAARPDEAPAPAAGDQQPDLPPTLQSPAEQSQPSPDFFADPFGDLSSPQLEADSPQAPADANDSDTADPIPLPDLTLPETSSPESPAKPAESADGAAGEPLSQPAPARPIPLPNDPQSDRQDTDARPVDPRAEGSLRRELEDFEMPRRPEDRRSAPPMGRDYGDVNLVKPAAYSCDDFRSSIAAATIQKVSLDISPPFRPDVIELDEYERIKRRFDEQQVVRDWQSIDGRKLGRGRMRNLAYENVVIETEFGTLEELPINRISEADLAYVSAQWGLPQECLIEQPRYRPRRWTEASITWKASNLMHKPLYYEEVNLERYGHTAGPWLQPVVSSAHFFANIAVMPYKMGVHLPGECQYALGYYRPGNCAPWITPPIPLSLRGALFQAGAVSGTALLTP